MSAHRDAIHVWSELGAAGAQRGAARGDVVVIIDALRASATIPTALAAGATAVIPALTVEQASAYLTDPDTIVAGERGGVRVPNLHFGNSPTEIWANRRQIAGKTLVLTTSNGTRCTHAALQGAAAVLTGALVNAAAVARTALHLARARGSAITLVAAGIGERPAIEDTFSLNIIAHRLVALGAATKTPLPPVDAATSLELFLSSKAASRLIDLGYDQDVHFCAQIDLWRIAPIYRGTGFVASLYHEP